MSLRAVSAVVLAASVALGSAPAVAIGDSSTSGSSLGGTSLGDISHDGQQTRSAHRAQRRPRHRRTPHRLKDAATGTGGSSGVSGQGVGSGSLGGGGSTLGSTGSSPGISQ
jgi:hypothetical protein